MQLWIRTEHISKCFCSYSITAILFLFAFSILLNISKHTLHAISYRYITGEICMKVVFLESWKSNFVNIKPNLIKERYSKQKIQFTEEIRRGNPRIRSLIIIAHHHRSSSLLIIIRKDLDSTYQNVVQIHGTNSKRT